MMKFQGQTHVVVGGGSFWGRAVSQQLAREGAHVAVIDSDAAAVNETCALIAGENGGRSTGFPVNIEDARALADVAAKLDAAGAVVRSLVTHYLVLDWHSVEDCDVAQFERVVTHNLVGPLKATQAFLPLLKKERDITPRIILYENIMMIPPHPSAHNANCIDPIKDIYLNKFKRIAKAHG